MWSRWQGASGFLGKKIGNCDGSLSGDESLNKDWEAFNILCSETASSKHWAAVYLASTPLQAAELGIESAGVDEVAPKFTFWLPFLYLSILICNDHDV